MTARVAVFDIGKTNAKLALVDLATRREVEVLGRPNRVLPGPPWPQYDTGALWQFLIRGLADLHRRHGIDAISVTTHGASAALLTKGGDLAAPPLDYEHDGPDAVAAAYDALRPDFAETGSPRLPGGLNVGAQLHWQFGTDPGLRDRVATVVMWPQYWGFRLTGERATDVASISCHSDLWNPYAGRLSSLVERLGLDGRIAPTRRPAEVLGSVTPEVAALTGLPHGTPVATGIHDSNASLLPHLLSRTGPFSVVSTGTWVVVMSVGGMPVALDPRRDAMVNTSALGQPVPSAKFMGGREHDRLLDGRPATATEADARRVRDGGILLLPSVVGGSGPYPDRAMRWLPGPPDAAAEEVAVGYYLALVTATCLKMTGGRGPVVVEGPFARNRWFLDMLAVAAGRPVLVSASQTGTAIGAALLFAGAGDATAVPDGPAHGVDPALAGYAAQWRALVPDGQG
ncbi:MAG: FGGY-family carbohydrate kinase [Gemmobacter sp.]